MFVFIGMIIRGTDSHLARYEILVFFFFLCVFFLDSGKVYCWTTVSLKKEANFCSLI